MRIIAIRAALAALGMMVGAAGRVEAGVLITIEQSGADVVASGSGTIDTQGLTQGGVVDVLGGVNPSTATVDVGVAGPPGGSLVREYTGISGPTSFGSGGPMLSGSPTGEAFGVVGYSETLRLPDGYVSGATLSGGATFSGQTLASLGLTPGTYTWTWGSGPTADSLTVQIGPATVTPEPSTLALAGLGAAIGGVVWYRRRLALATA